ncbi:MAG: DUF5069 domain-containing protein [Opitutaceae bacterium]
MSDSIKSAYLNPSAASAGAVDFNAPDLTRHPPRSARVRLGGYAHLPRMIDKARAFAAGRNGDFHYNCPIDQRFFSFTGIDPDAFLAQVKAGKSDGELLAYVNATAKPKRHPAEIAAWTAWYEQVTPSAPDGRGYFNDVHRKNAPNRDDIVNWCDWLDLDDFVTFGGKA